MKGRHLAALITWGLLGSVLAGLWLLSTPARATPAADSSPGLAALTVCPAGPPACDYAQIQAAVDAAAPGTLVKVAAGTYTGVLGRPAPPGYPSPPPSGTVSQVVYLDKTLTLRGGYVASDFGLPPDPVANPTTLDAGGQGRALFVAGGANPTIEGLRLTGGDSTGLGGDLLYGQGAGGGLYVLDAAATLRDCQVYDNAAGGSGGGLYALTAALTVEDCAVNSNTAGFEGGGLLLTSSDATLEGNDVSSNTAIHYGGGLSLHLGDVTLAGNTVSGNGARSGGGLYLYKCPATLAGNTVDGNTAVERGGGLWLWSSDATLEGNAITGNTAGESGGGLDLAGSDAVLGGNVVAGNTTAGAGGGLYLGGSDATLINNIVADNQAGGDGCGLSIVHAFPRLWHTTVAHFGDSPGCSGIHVTDSGASTGVVLTNTILVNHSVGIAVSAGNTATLEATLWGSGAWANDTDWAGAGAIFTGTVGIWGDPDFLDPAAGDYHIGPDSAAMDAGVNAGIDVDIDGDPRPLSVRYDIGADERPCFVPGAPTQSTPPDEGLACRATLAFAWSKETGARSYRIQVDDDRDFSSPLTDIATTKTTYTPGSPLAPGVYYWRVKSLSPCGNSAWSLKWKFTVPVVPPEPSLASPLDGAITCDLQPEFGWSAADGATSYRLQVDDDAAFSSPEIDETTPDTAFTPGSALSYGGHFWRVRAANECEHGPWSLSRSFSIRSQPPAPSLSSPSDGGVVGDGTPIFTWEGTQGATSYRIEVDDDPAFASPAIDDTTEATFYEAGSPLGEDLTYNWRVQAANFCGAGAWSAVRRFTIDTTCDPSPPPSLLDPPDGGDTCDRTPLFRWTGVSGATAYRLQVDDDGGFGSPEIDQATGGTDYTPGTSLAPGAYAWRARSINDCDAGPWSASHAFTILDCPIHYVYLPRVVWASP